MSKVHVVVPHIGCKNFNEDLQLYKNVTDHMVHGSICLVMCGYQPLLF